MFYPTNRPVSRPRVSQVDTDRMSERLTAGLRAIQERDRNHDALVLRADQTLRSWRTVEPLRTITTEDIDRMLCI